jgi:molybdate transport system ATP-binding protein
VGGEIIPPHLSVRVRKTRADAYSGERAHDHSPFVLDVTAEIPAGITILFGPSGAGKSTLLDCIAGLVHPDAGQISIAGETLLDTDRGINLPARKRHIAYVFQNLALFPHLTVEQNVAYGLAHLQPSERAARLQPSERAARLASALEALRVQKFEKRKPGELSGGERQRVALARSLATSPRVLLLDEPLTALDAGLKKSIMDDLSAWNAAQNIPILYVTHSRNEVDALGERVIALDQGKILGAGTPHEILETPRQSPLAQAAGFENLLLGTVTQLRESDGVMTVRLENSNCEIETPLGYSKVGDKVKLAIRAGDILLATNHPQGLSARNIIPGKIASLNQRGVTVIAQVLAGASSVHSEAAAKANPENAKSAAQTNLTNPKAVSFTVHLTPGARRQLQLAVHQQIFLVLKTHSCHILTA